MEQMIIRTEGLKKSFGEVQAVKGVDLFAEQGTVFGLLGPNGAGKTTTIRILTTLDEPTTGLDPRSRLVLWDLIRDLQREGTTVLLCTQYLEEADHLCDRIAVIDLGTVIA